MIWRKCTMSINIYQRKDGRYEGRITMEKVNGKRKYKAFFGRTSDEVMKKITYFHAIKTCMVSKRSCFPLYIQNGLILFYIVSRNQRQQIIRLRLTSIFFRSLEIRISAIFRRIPFIGLSGKNRIAGCQTGILQTF